MDYVFGRDAEEMHMCICACSDTGFICPLGLCGTGPQGLNCSTNVQLTINKKNPWKNKVVNVTKIMWQEGHLKEWSMTLTMTMIVSISSPVEENIETILKGWSSQCVHLIINKKNQKNKVWINVDCACRGDTGKWRSGCLSLEFMRRRGAEFEPFT